MDGDTRQRANSLPSSSKDAAVSPLIDWHSPGSALHDHIEQQKLATGKVEKADTLRRSQQGLRSLAIYL